LIKDRNMIKPQIIGLAGPAGCGKDTVAQLLATHLGFSHFAFADALRVEVCEAFGIDASLLTRRDTKELPNPALALERCRDFGFVGAVVARVKGLQGFDQALAHVMHAPRSPRQTMQWWGTDYRRQHSGMSYWTRTLTHRVHAQQHGQQWRHVISDVRFPNEADAVRALGGVIWQVKRPGLRLDTSHISEVDGSQFKPDAVVNNRHDLKHLQGVVMCQWFMREAGLTAAQVMDAGYAVEYADEPDLPDLPDLPA
jgi:hypothetical protein